MSEKRNAKAYTVSDFHKGQRVQYVSTYAGEILGSAYGVVSSKNDRYVFVKFDNSIMRMVTGDEPYTAQACNPENLIHNTPSGEGEEG